MELNLLLVNEFELELGNPPHIGLLLALLSPLR